MFTNRVKSLRNMNNKWFIFNSETINKSDGDSVDVWKDISGNGNDAEFINYSATTIAKPIYKHKNPYNLLDFQNASGSSGLQIKNTAITIGNTDSLAFALSMRINYDGANQNHQTFLHHQNKNNTYGLFMISFVNGRFQFFWNGNGYDLSGSKNLFDTQVFVLNQNQSKVTHYRNGSKKKEVSISNAQVSFSDNLWLSNENTDANDSRQRDEPITVLSAKGFKKNNSDFSDEEIDEIINYDYIKYSRLILRSY